MKEAMVLLNEDDFELILDALDSKESDAYSDRARERVVRLIAYLKLRKDAAN